MYIALFYFCVLSTLFCLGPEVYFLDKFEVGKINVFNFIIVFFLIYFHLPRRMSIICTNDLQRD